MKFWRYWLFDGEDRIVRADTDELQGVKDAAQRYANQREAIIEWEAYCFEDGAEIDRAEGTTYPKETLDA